MSDTRKTPKLPSAQSNGKRTPKRGPNAAKRVWVPKAFGSETGSDVASGSSSPVLSKSKSAAKGKGKSRSNSELAEQFRDMQAQAAAAIDAARDKAAEVRDLEETLSVILSQKAEAEHQLSEAAKAVAEAKEHEEQVISTLQVQCRDRDDELIKNVNIKVPSAKEPKLSRLALAASSAMTVLGVASVQVMKHVSCPGGNVHFQIFGLLKGSCLLMGAAAVVIGAKFCRRPLVDEYVYKGPLEYELTDRRPDVVSMGQLKHQDARYAYIRLTQRCGLVEALRSVYLGDSRPGVSHTASLFGSKRHTDMVVSTELVKQLAVPQTLDLAASPDVVWDRMTHMSKSLHSVNVSRDFPLKHEFVVQQSLLVSFALYRELQFKLGALPFPKPRLI